MRVPLRRIATPDVLNRRYATRFSLYVPVRGLKPTAAVMASLRDESQPCCFRPSLQRNEKGSGGPLPWKSLGLATALMALWPGGFGKSRARGGFGDAGAVGYGHGNGRRNAGTDQGTDRSGVGA